MSVGATTADGKWDNPYGVHFHFNIAGKNFTYGQNLRNYDWFIQELLPGGKLGMETASGIWKNPYAVQFPFQIGGRQFFFGQNLSTFRWFIQE